MKDQHAARSWLRTRIAATLAVTAVATVGVASLAAGPSAAASGSAAPSGAARPSTPAQADDAPRGTAKAVGSVVRIAPGVGGLALAVELGVSVTDVTNAVAQAQGKAVDLGLIGTSLTAGGACGDASIRPEDLPQPVRVDNRNGDVTDGEDFAPFGPGTVGRVRVEATTKPSSHASTTAGDIGLDGVLTISAGRSTASTEIDPASGTRAARAVSEVDIDIAGVVQLQGLRWTAQHQSGAETTASGTFELAGAGVAGIPLPIDELEPLQAGLNEALALTGIRVELPRVIRFTEPADVIRVTPLRIIMQDTPLGATLLAPLLTNSREARNQLLDVLKDAVCEAAGAAFVADIVLTILAGSGSLALEIGGAEATSADLVIQNPFGTIGPAAPTVAEQLTEQPPPPPPTATDPPPTAAAPAAAPPPAGDEQATALPTAPVSAVEQLCESVHPFRWPSCSNGAAMPLALLGITATAAMALLDWRHQRRRLAPVEVAGGAA